MLFSSIDESTIIIKEKNYSLSPNSFINSEVENTLTFPRLFSALSFDHRGIPRYNASPIKRASSFTLSGNKDLASS